MCLFILSSVILSEACLYLTMRYFIQLRGPSTTQQSYELSLSVGSKTLLLLNYSRQEMLSSPDSEPFTLKGLHYALFLHAVSGLCLHAHEACLWQLQKRDKRGYSSHELRPNTCL